MLRAIDIMQRPLLSSILYYCHKSSYYIYATTKQHISRQYCQLECSTTAHKFFQQTFFSIFKKNACQLGSCLGLAVVFQIMLSVFLSSSIHDEDAICYTNAFHCNIVSFNNASNVNNHRYLADKTSFVLVVTCFCLLE